MSIPSRSFRRRIQLAAVLACVALVIIDRFVPLEAAVGVLYVPIVVLAMLSRRPRFVILIGLLSTAFTWFDFFSSIGESSTTWAIFDRSVATIAIWISVGLGVRFVRAQAALERSCRVESLFHRELSHRVRGNLAFLNAMINLHAQDRDPSRPSLAEALRLRVKGMADVHDLLTAQRWYPVHLRELVAALAPRQGGGTSDLVRAVGPDTLIPASQVTGLGVVLHELILNSAKHGALGAPDGHLEIQWDVAYDAAAGSRRLELFWQEFDGPDICDYPAPGAGMQLIAEFVREVLGGEIEFAYPRGGAFHRVTLLLSDEPDPFSSDTPDAPTPPRETATPQKAPAQPATRAAEGLAPRILRPGLSIRPVKLRPGIIL
jgi:two-component sensor histidine kinase